MLPVDPDLYLDYVWVGYPWYSSARYGEQPIAGWTVDHRHGQLQLKRSPLTNFAALCPSMTLCYYHVPLLFSHELYLLLLNHECREELVVEDLAKLLPAYLLGMAAH